MLRLNLIGPVRNNPLHNLRVYRHSGKANFSFSWRVKRDNREYLTWAMIDIHGMGVTSIPSYYELKKVNGVIPSIDN